MAKAARARVEDPESLSKKELQREMEKTRESVSETVNEIKQTVSHQYQAAKDTVAGVLDYREQFQKEPLVWSLGALSAGFALGYTMGYAHKNSRGAKQTPVMAFADSLVEELSTVGQGLVMPALDARVKELFGFEFSDLLDQVKSAKPRSKKRTKRVKSSKPVSRRAREKKS